MEASLSIPMRCVRSAMMLLRSGLDSDGKDESWCAARESVDAQFTSRRVPRIRLCPAEPLAGFVAVAEDCARGHGFDESSEHSAETVVEVVGGKEGDPAQLVVRRNAVECLDDAIDVAGGEIHLGGCGIDELFVAQSAFLGAML